MLFSKALLAATYRNGTPPTRTKEHEKAEFHRFKTEHLFKTKTIPKNLYVARLIQHFVILETIETQLRNLTDKTPINAFFTLSYLEELWRTPGIKTDLEQLGVKPEQIDVSQIAPATKTYIENIKQLPPKSLLAHFLTHVAGFMHGGNIIRSKYITPSNRLTHYQIPMRQYDFLSAATMLPKRSSSALTVYEDMMDNVDTITLSDEEAQEVLQQGKEVYATMVNIYDDLCDMHTKQYNLSPSLIAVIAISMMAIYWVLNSLSPLMDSNNSSEPRLGM